MNKNHENKYQTSDTALAAYLISQGYEYLELDVSNPRSAVFFFENNSSAFQESLKQFQLGEASGNILAFFRAYKKLLFQIKEQTSHVR